MLIQSRRNHTWW